MKLAAEVNDNEYCDRDDGRQNWEAGKQGRISIGKKHCIKINPQNTEAIMNYLIPFEFHGANSDEPQPLKLL